MLTSCHLHKECHTFPYCSVIGEDGPERTEEPNPFWAALVFFGHSSPLQLVYLWHLGKQILPHLFVYIRASAQDTRYGRRPSWRQWGLEQLPLLPPGLGDADYTCLSSQLLVILKGARKAHLYMGVSWCEIKICLHSIIYKSQRWEQPKCPSTAGWMKCGRYIQCKIIQPHKEGNSDTCSNVGEPWRHYAK